MHLSIRGHAHRHLQSHLERSDSERQRPAACGEGWTVGGGVQGRRLALPGRMKTKTQVSQRYMDTREAAGCGCAAPNLRAFPGAKSSLNNRLTAHPAIKPAHCGANQGSEGVHFMLDARPLAASPPMFRASRLIRHLRRSADAAASARRGGPCPVTALIDEQFQRSAAKLNAELNYQSKFRRTYSTEASESGVVRGAKVVRARRPPARGSRPPATCRRPARLPQHVAHRPPSHDARGVTKGRKPAVLLQTWVDNNGHLKLQRRCNLEWEEGHPQVLRLGAGWWWVAKHVCWDGMVGIVAAAAVQPGGGKGHTQVLGLGWWGGGDRGPTCEQLSPPPNAPLPHIHPPPPRSLC